MYSKAGQGRNSFFQNECILHLHNEFVRMFLKISAFLTADFVLLVVNTCKYMYRLLGHVSAIDKSVLDQVLSRKRPTSRWDRPFGEMFARLASPYSSLSTLPGAASAVLASSPADGCCFRFLVKISQSFISTYTSVHTNLGQRIQKIEWGSR